MTIQSKNIKMLKDFAINIVATVIPIALLQLLIFPQLAAVKGNAVYGYIVTIISIMTLFSDLWGNVLNNVRLLQNDKYSEKGDFNLILLFGVIFNIAAVSIGFSIYSTGIEGLLGVLIASALILMRSYFIVTFRLNLSYVNILINNVILSVGYLAGFLLFRQFDKWTLIYLAGNVLSLLHLWFKSDLMREPLRRTALFWPTFKKFLVLYVAFFLKNFVTYADKLLIFPILGAEAVAYYYAASVMGKMMSMAISPISSVVLSYVVKMGSLSKKTIRRILLLILCISVLGYAGAYFVGRILLKLLYRSWFEITVELLPWTVLAAVLVGVTSVLQPFILKYKNEMYQILINLVHFCTYVSVSLFFAKIYGLKGFCIGYCVTMTVKLLIDLVLLRTIGKESV